MKLYKYATRYKWEPDCREEGYTKEDAGEDGLCDAMIMISILLPPDGRYSQCLFSFNGKENGRDFTQDEIFKAWMTLGISLHDQGGLKGWKKEFVKFHTEAIREMFKH